MEKAHDVRLANQIYGPKKGETVFGPYERYRRYSAAEVGGRLTLYGRDGLVALSPEIGEVVTLTERDDPFSPNPATYWLRYGPEPVSDGGTAFRGLCRVEGDCRVYALGCFKVVELGEVQRKPHDGDEAEWVHRVHLRRVRCPGEMA